MFSTICHFSFTFAQCYRLPNSPNLFHQKFIQYQSHHRTETHVLYIPPYSVFTHFQHTQLNPPHSRSNSDLDLIFKLQEIHRSIYHNYNALCCAAGRLVPSQQEYQCSKFIQCTASITRGMSGGPVINPETGCMVGIGKESITITPPAALVIAVFLTSIKNTFTVIGCRSKQAFNYILSVYHPAFRWGYRKWVLGHTDEQLHRFVETVNDMDREEQLPW